METKTKNEIINKVDELETEKKEKTITTGGNKYGENEEELSLIEKAMDAEKTKRKYSPSYMLNNYKTLIKNLDETGMLDKEDKEVLKKLGQKMIERFISLNMFD